MVRRNKRTRKSYTDASLKLAPPAWAFARIELDPEYLKLAAKLDPEYRAVIEANLSLPEILAIAHAAREKGRKGRKYTERNQDWIERVAQCKARSVPYLPMARLYRPGLAERKAKKDLGDFVYRHREAIGRRVRQLKSSHV